MELIEFRNISKSYNSGIVALDNISFNVEKGEWVSLVGKSGAGKSTLFKLILLEEKPTRGRIFFDGVDIIKLKNYQIPYYRRKIGVVFQDFKLLASRTALENVAFAMEVAGKSEKEIRHTTSDVLELVGLSNRSQNFPHELSGGEKQRLTIARALVQHPEAILADEPTGNLDPINSWEIMQLLLKINQFGTAVILATHNRDIVNNLGRRVISIENGKIIRDEEKGGYVLT